MRNSKRLCLKKSKNKVKQLIFVEMVGQIALDTMLTYLYGTYSLMDENSGKIVDFSLVHVGEVSSSNAMENEGCQRSLNHLLRKK